MSGEKIEINNGRGAAVDASNIKVSGYAAIGMLGTLFVAAFYMASLINGTEAKIEALSKNTDNQISEVSRQVGDLVKAVEKLQHVSSDRYTKHDAAWRCVMTALANPGYVCVNPLADMTPFIYSGVGRNDWNTEVKRD